MSSVITTTLHEGRRTIEFGLKSASDVMEVIYNETQSLVHDSRVSSALDQLNSSMEAFESLIDFGSTREDIDKEIAKLKEAFTTKMVSINKA